MTDKECYNKLMTSFFGNDWQSIEDDGGSNNFIGALANKTDYAIFKEQFTAITERLKDIYKKDLQNYHKLLKIYKDLADKKNCDGAMAELIALDVLNINGYSPIQIDITLNASESFASRFARRQNTNEDGCLSEFNLHFDVKSFQDTVRAILKSITNKIISSKHKNGEIPPDINLHVEFEFPLTDSEEKYKARISDLIKEFDAKLIVGINSIQSTVIPELRYVLNWGGVSSTISSYSPYKRAEDLVEPFLCRYVDKFLLSKPFILVVVNHSWFNQVDTGAFDSNKVLYRSLSRRLFMQYRHDSRMMSDLCHDFTGTETIDMVTRKLSGILYIDSRPTFPAEKRNQWYFYSNPRSDNHISSKSLLLDELITSNRQCIEIDDFADDNY